jgi:glucosamine-6-phosphate deaminase
MRVLVTPDYRTLSEEAAALVARAVRAKPDITLGLPTGSTPLGMYEELIRKHRHEGLDFSRVRTFNLDEYLGLAPDDPQSYHAYMHGRFFDHVNIAVHNTRIPDGSPGVDADAECGRYEDEIRNVGGIDLLIVGIGSNGHIAFNEPGSSFESRTQVVTLAPETIENAKRHFPGDANIPMSAITIGIRTILDARRILLLASGSGKAEAVERTLRDPVSESVPASALRLHPDVIAILDESARRR